MIKYTIPCSGEKVVLNATVFSENPVDLILCGKSVSDPRIVYFKRDVANFTGKHYIDVPMPITPNKLSFLLYDKNRPDSNELKVSNLYAAPLAFNITSPYNTEKDIEFYIFLFWFCEHFKTLPAGHYYSEHKNFSIDYTNKIFNEDGTESTTPSRVNRVTAEIEVSKGKCKVMTVYMMAMILLHEYFHYRIKSTDEEAVDAKAMVMYKDMGFPSSEALYSFINVFDPKTDSHSAALKQRTEKLFAFLSKQKN